MSPIRSVSAISTVGRISQLDHQPFSKGTQAVMFSNWGHLHLDGCHLKLTRSIEYSEWVVRTCENLCIVEAGQAVIEFDNHKHTLTAGMAFKVFPGQAPKIVPDGTVTLLSVQMPVEHRVVASKSALLIVDPSLISSRVYEYETLGKEVITCDYSPGLGLIHFVFPQDKIPLHCHPFAGRLIRTISGIGYVYLDGERYPMNSDTFALFEKGVIHTNGPATDSVYELWAIQLPWVPSGVTDFEIGGHEDFVRYIESVPPREQWKIKEQLEAYRLQKQGRNTECGCCQGKVHASL